MLKKVFALALAGLLCLSLAGCQLPTPKKELSDEAVVTTLLDCFRQGDYDGLKPFISDDNPLHTLFQNAQGTGAIAAPWQAALRQAGGLTYTAQAVAGKEAWGTVAVTLTMSDHTYALHDQLVEALIDQVMTGEGTFRDVPGWMTKAMTGPGETREESFELHVGNRDGNNVMDTNTNRQFFAMLCGGLRPYRNVTLTTCTFPNGELVWELVSQGDEIIAMFTEEFVSGEGYEQEALEYGAQVFVEQYIGIDGIYAGTDIDDAGLHARLGIDMEEASSYTLEKLGIINQRLTAGSNGWLSLESTISSATREGASCVTEDFR